MNITGKMHEVHNTQQVSETFKKRTFVIEYVENPQYPELIVFEVIRDRCSLLDDFAVGQMLTVHFNLKGRKWVSPSGETKYFNTLQAWKLEPSEHATSNAGGDVPSNRAAQSLEDDLPF